jgi:hypothetical protein
MLKLRTSGEMRVKRIAALALAVMMTVGAAGCSSSGKKFKKAEEKLIAAAENCCDAAVMGKALRKKYTKRNLKLSGSTDGEGLYATYNSDDLENIEFDERDYGELDSEDVKNITVFLKSDSSNMITARVLELKNKDAAQELFDYYKDMIDLDSQKHKWKRSSDGEFATDEDKDDTLAFIALVDGYCKSGYFHVDGNLLTAVSFTGYPENDLLEEYYDFMREAEYTDMEALLKGDLED